MFIGISALAFCLVTFQALAFWVMVFWLLAFQLWRFVRIPMCNVWVTLNEMVVFNKKMLFYEVYCSSFHWSYLWETETVQVLSHPCCELHTCVCAIKVKLTFTKMNTARLHDALDSEISKNLYRQDKERAILAKTRVKLFKLITALMILMSVSWLFWSVNGTKIQILCRINMKGFRNISLSRLTWEPPVRI